MARQAKNAQPESAPAAKASEQAPPAATVVEATGTGTIRGDVLSSIDEQEQGQNQPGTTESGTNQPAPPATRAANEEEADDVIDDSGQVRAGTVVPCDNGDTEASERQRELLLEACDRFGVNPFLEQYPRELLAWKHYQGKRIEGIPASVVIVTAGGVKLRYYEDQNYLAPNCTEPGIDQDTEETLARLLSAFGRNPTTKEVTRLPLPEDLALPAVALTGRTTATRHVYRRGYLKAGGRKAADRREKQERRERRAAEK